MTEIHTALTVTDSMLWMWQLTRTLDRVSWFLFAWLFLGKVALLIAAYWTPGGHVIASQYMKWEVRWFILASPVAFYELSFGMAFYALATGVTVGIYERQLDQLRALARDYDYDAARDA